MSDPITKPANRFSIPVEERIRFYYIRGYEVEAIAEMVSSEFQEFECQPIEVSRVRAVVKGRKREFEAMRQEFLLETREQYKVQLGENFHRVIEAESQIVRMTVNKMKDLVQELEDLDISEKTEDGLFKNMGQYATLMLSLKATHEMAAKLSGTDAAREVMTFVKKTQVKEMAARKSGLHGAMEADVTFLDDMDQYGPNMLT